MRSIVILVVLGLLLGSCQKELPSDLLGRAADISSNRIKTYIELDTLGALVDTLTKTSFEYDNLNRLIKETTVSYTGNLPDPTNNYSKIYYYYNGTDTLVNKRVEMYLDQVNLTDSAISVYTRNASGQVTRDSTITYSINGGVPDTAVSISLFSFYADSVIENNRSYYSSAPIPLDATFKHEITAAGGNPTREILSYQSGTGYMEIRRAVFAHDNKINPFLVRAVNYPVSLQNNIDLYLYPEINNLTQLVLTDFPGAPVTENLSYKYTTAGLPATVVRVDPTDPTSAIKGIFKY